MISREFPPAPSGGIGTYASIIAPLLASRSEVVHVITQKWPGAEADREEQCSGRLVIHRLPFGDRPSSGLRQRIRRSDSEAARALFQSPLPVQSFAWQACELAESLIESEPEIDVIEAPEFEAPAYFLQLRRALGMGPARQPPILIHLHSPTELIARHNDWPSGLPDLLLAEQLESYSIAAADGWICPSAYLASQAEQMYGLKPGSIDVIRYPVADWATVERSHRGLGARVDLLRRAGSSVARASWSGSTPPSRSPWIATICASSSSARTSSAPPRLPATTSSAVASRRRCASASSFRGHVAANRRCPPCTGRCPHRGRPLALGELPLRVPGGHAVGPPGAGDPRRWHGGDRRGRANGVDRAVRGRRRARRCAASRPRRLTERLAEMGAEAARTVRRMCAADEIVARHLELRERACAIAEQCGRPAFPNLASGSEGSPLLVARRAEEGRRTIGGRGRGRARTRT